MVKGLEKLVGICGIYCGTCPYYVAFQKDDRALQQEISGRQGVSIEEIRCEGCLSEKVSVHCASCQHGFRQCASEQGVTWCFQCHEFPCKRLEDFQDIHVVNNISHHGHVIEDLRYMQQHGTENWLKIQENTGKCRECGTMLYWFERQCSHCQAEVTLG